MAAPRPDHTLPRKFIVPVCGEGLLKQTRLVTCVTPLTSMDAYTLFKLKIIRLSRIGLLILLLLIGGVLGVASHLCAMHSSSHVRECCLGSNGMFASVSEASNTQFEAASCGKVGPPQSKAIQAPPLSTCPIDGVPAFHAASASSLRCRLRPPTLVPVFPLSEDSKAVRTRHTLHVLHLILFLVRIPQAISGL